MDQEKTATFPLPVAARSNPARIAVPRKAPKATHNHEGRLDTHAICVWGTALPWALVPARYDASAPTQPDAFVPHAEVLSPTAPRPRSLRSSTSSRLVLGYGNCGTFFFPSQQWCGKLRLSHPREHGLGNGRNCAACKWRGTLRSLPQRRPAPGKPPHGAAGVDVGAHDRKEVRPANRGHRSRALRFHATPNRRAKRTGNRLGWRGSNPVLARAGPRRGRRAPLPRGLRFRVLLLA